METIQYLRESKKEKYDTFFESNFSKSEINLKLEFKKQQTLQEQANIIGKLNQLKLLNICLSSVDAKRINLRSVSQNIKNLILLKSLKFEVAINNMASIKCFYSLFENLRYLNQLQNLKIVIQWNLINPAELIALGSQLCEMKNLTFLQLSNTSDSDLQDNVITILNDSLQKVTQLQSLNIDLKTEKQIIFLNLIDFMPQLDLKQFKIQDKQFTFYKNQKTQKVTQFEYSMKQLFNDVETQWLQHGLSQLRSLTSLVINLEEESQKCSIIKENCINNDLNNSLFNLISLKKLKIQSKFKINQKLLLNWFSKIESKGKLSQLHFDFEEECSIKLLVELSNQISKFNNLHKLVVHIKHYQINKDYNLFTKQLIHFGKTVEYLDTNISPLLIFKYIENNQQLKAITFNNLISDKDEIDKVCQSISSINSLDQLALNINKQEIKYNKLNFNFDLLQKIKDTNIQINIYNINYLFDFLKYMKKIKFCSSKNSYSLNISFGYDDIDTCQYGNLKKFNKDAKQRISLSLITRKLQKSENEVILRIKENKFIQQNNSEQLAICISQLTDIKRLQITIFEIQDKRKSLIAAKNMIQHLRKMNQQSILDIYIYRNNLYYEDVLNISKLISNFNSLSHCSLKIGYENSIQTKGACEIGRGIAFCKQLQSLNLQFGTGNKINNQGVIGLFEGIQQLSLLERLQFVVYPSNELDKDVYQIIFQGCTNLSKLYHFELLLNINNNSASQDLILSFACLKNIKYLGMKFQNNFEKQISCTKMKAIKELKRLIVFKQYSRWELI